MLTIGMLSGVLNFSGALLLIFDVLKKKTIPERATYFIWTVLGVAIFLSQLSIGATDSLWFTGLQTLGIAIIFVLSIKHGTGGFSKIDIASILLAGLGIALWVVISQPVITLLLLIFVRSLGAIDTIVKTYKQPQTEAALPWLMFAGSAVLAMVSVGKIDFALLAYPIYVLTADASVMIAKYHKNLRV